MSELTDAAKAAIADAVRIVREDKFEEFVRGRLSKEDNASPKEDELIKPTSPPTTSPATPPPPKDAPQEDKPTVQKHPYWGELLN